jgi:hypothetical protein
LRPPDLEFAKTAVLGSQTRLDAQRGYRHSIDEFVDWFCSEPRLAFNRIVVLKYRTCLEARQLASCTIDLRLGAVSRLAYEAAICVSRAPPYPRTLSTSAFRRLNRNLSSGSGLRSLSTSRLQLDSQTMR